ncbi:hypothetical protein JB92DRAFT_3109264 [Gautieria morchelliformis]|nr:hypothetical protein JB92DRAFT_3109264 [Gautieria morchelliformis]
MESLSRQVLEANEKHKLALDQYTRKLQTELDTVDKLISAVENISDENLQEDAGDKWCLHADGALKPSGIIDHTQVLDERSPFFAEALLRKRYTKCLVADPCHSKVNAREKKSLEKAIIKENKRLAALRAQQRGQDAFEAVLRLDSESFLHGVEGISWENVARDVSASGSPGGRTAQECKVRWLGSQYPKINVQRWSEDEENRLHDLVESKRESGRVDWEEISTLLETNRAALDCIKHFKTRPQLPVRWTSTLDNKLLEAVERHGSNNWVLVAYSVSQHVSANQCQIRYERSLNPEIKRGKFTDEEDERLMKSIEVHGTDWVKVAQDVPGRTNAQCRGRYTLNMGSQQWDKVRLEIGGTRSQKQCGTEDTSFQAVWRIGESDSSQTRTVPIGPIPNVTWSHPITNGEGNNSNPVPVTTDDGPSTASKATGAKRGRKRKAPPSAPEEPLSTGTIAVPADLGTDTDVDAITQNLKNCMGEPSRMSGLAPENIASPKSAKKRGNLKTKRALPAAKRRARPTPDTTLESKSTHTMVTRASKRRREA